MSSEASSKSSRVASLSSCLPFLRKKQDLKCSSCGLFVNILTLLAVSFAEMRPSKAFSSLSKLVPFVDSITCLDD